ncbi:unnamed protein product [Diplocarpon coronariae]
MHELDSDVAREGLACVDLSSVYRFGCVDKNLKLEARNPNRISNEVLRSTRCSVELMRRDEMLKYEGSLEITQSRGSGAAIISRLHHRLWIPTGNNLRTSSVLDQDDHAKRLRSRGVNSKIHFAVLIPGDNRSPTNI